MKAFEWVCIAGIIWFEPLPVNLRSSNMHIVRWYLRDSSAVSMKTAILLQKHWANIRSAFYSLSMQLQHAPTC